MRCPRCRNSQDSKLQIARLSQRKPLAFGIIDLPREAAELGKAVWRHHLYRDAERAPDFDLIRLRLAEIQRVFAELAVQV